MGDTKGDTMSPIPAADLNSKGDIVTAHTLLYERRRGDGRRLTPLA